MKFAKLAEYFEQLEATPSRLKMTEILAEVFREASDDEIGEICYLSLGRLVPHYESLEFNLADKMVVRAIGQVTGKQISEVTKVYKQLGDVGLVAEKLKDIEISRYRDSKLNVLEVYGKLRKIAEDSGQGSQERKVSGLAELFGGVDATGAKYVARMVVGKLRLGFSVMTIIDALSWMKTGGTSLRGELEQAYCVRADIGELAREAKKHKSIKSIKPELGVPIMPALCQRLKTADEMIAKMGTVAVEPKFDGTRVTIHLARSGWHVAGGGGSHKPQATSHKPFLRTFTRNLEETTHMFPELLEAHKEVRAESVILDSEAVGVNPKTGKLMSFQETIIRKRKHMVAEASLRVPLKFFVFDVLYLNGESLLNKPLHERREILKRILQPKKIFELTEQIVTEDAEKLREYHDKQLAEGLEGAVVKKIDGEYIPGRRGWNWVKFKEEETAAGGLSDTLDCVVMGYYRGKGKRTGFGLGAFLVGVRGNAELKMKPFDSAQGKNEAFDEGKFYTIAKIGTGLSDGQWKEMYQRAEKYKTLGQPKEYVVHKSLVPDVWVTPAIVVEIAADNLTKSPNHSAGVALRFPRLVKFRDDKNLEQVTSLEEVKRMH